MSGVVESVSILPPWSAFGRQGAFASGAFVAQASGPAPITDGDQVLTLDAFPPDFFAPIVDTIVPANNKPASGFGTRFVFDPGSANEQVIEVAQPKGFDPDPSTKIYLKDPLVIVGGPLVANVNLGFPPSPALMVGNFPKDVTFRAVSYAVDARGAAACTTPGVSFVVKFGMTRDGPFHAFPGITNPPDIPALAGVGENGYTLLSVTLPPMPYLIVEAVVGVGDGGDTVFALEVMRSER